MRVFKYIFSFIIIGFIIFNNVSLNKIVYSENKIEVEVKGKIENEGIFILDSNSTFNDLLKLIELDDDADISDFSLQQPLYNKQIIVIGSNEIKKISINTANLEELCSLNGIGEKTAEAIIKYRESNNGFKYLEELKKVKGIGDKKFEKIKDQLSL